MILTAIRTMKTEANIPCCRNVVSRLFRRTLSCMNFIVYRELMSLKLQAHLTHACNREYYLCEKYTVHLSLAFYQECRSLIGYAAHYLSCCRQWSEQPRRCVVVIKMEATLCVFKLSVKRIQTKL